MTRYNVRKMLVKNIQNSYSNRDFSMVTPTAFYCLQFEHFNIQHSCRVFMAFFSSSFLNLLILRENYVGSQITNSRPPVVGVPKFSVQIMGKGFVH